MKRSAKILVYFIMSSTLLLFMLPAYGWHWGPDPAWWPGDYGHTVWGELTGFTGLDSSSEIGTFRVTDDLWVGVTNIVVSGGYWYNLIIHATSTSQFEVYFLVWDGAQELNANPNFTASPASPPHQTRQDLQSDQAVPEPSSILMLVISLGIAYFFITHLKQRDRARALVSLRREACSLRPLRNELLG